MFYFLISSKQAIEVIIYRNKIFGLEERTTLNEWNEIVTKYFLKRNYRAYDFKSKLMWWFFYLNAINRVFLNSMFKKKDDKNFLNI